MLNQDIFTKAPKQNRLVNNGVAEVSEDHSASALTVLRYELETFVCNGQYEKGMERLLNAFLQNLTNAAEQPGVWISGFYGSGKSHMAKMLRTLWTDLAFPDGATARAITRLPDSVQDLLKELSTQGKRLGGLKAASGKLGAAASESVRVALQEIVFRSAGLPEKYHHGRFVLWLQRKGLLDALKAEIEGKGEDFERELKEMYVSPVLANALLKVYPDFADNAKNARMLLKDQYREVTDLSNDELVDAIHDALAHDNKFPLTVIVLDEVQQYIGDSADRAYRLQEAVETCCKHFSGRLLFVGTGQTALAGTPTLSKLLGRFPVQVSLSDTDVEGVIREIILAKKTSAVPTVEKVLQDNLGEISRHLHGTKLEHTLADEDVMVADYPILPVRRRFWERVMRAVDTTGTVAQLRNQLRVVHEAVIATGDQPLGHVVAGDFIYDQNAVSLLQTAALSREAYNHIEALAAGKGDDPLKARLLKLIYLIGKLPTEAVADTGVRATADTLADLLLVDLPAGSADLRKRVPDLLHVLQEKDGLVMGITTGMGVEYRLQTRESSAWQDEYRHQESELKSSVTRIEQERTDLFRKMAGDTLRQVRLTQGKEARDLSPSFDAELPKDHAQRIVAWIQDGWQTDEKSFLAEARAVGNSDPSLFVYLPARNKTDLANAIVAMKAAKATLDTKGVPSTPEGEEALSAMTTRLKAAERQIQTLLAEVFAGARVFQAGGTEVTDPDDLAGKLSAAGQKSVVRLYPQFDVADQAGWEKALERARKNDSQALEAIGYKGDPDKHPVCAAILKFIAGGKKGSEIRDYFRAPPYGWPQDAVDGALYALLASGHLRALDAAHKAVDAKGLERNKLTQASFKPESVTVSPVQLIQLRKLMQEVGIACQPQEELQKAMLLLEELKYRAAKAGGEAPKPAVPDVSHINQLEQLAGNALLVQLHADRDKLLADANAWQQAGQATDKRWPNWIQLSDLLNQAKDLGPHEELAEEAKAIADQRALLATPDPVQALLEKTVDLLRRSLNHHVQAFQDEYTARLTALQADESWQKLSAADQTTILKECGLEPAQMPDMSSAAALEQALDECPLARWADKREALANRFDQARQKAVQKVTPKAMPVQLPHRVLSSQDELKAWLDEVEKLLKERLGQGPVSL
ncbi:MAG: BREX system P-loop protein BrxC [Rhodocyclaceae bacterium]|nr:BREX system P-loop protein BrxC [Rhodocyclaceae bacterium]